MKVRWWQNGFMFELPNIAAYAYLGVHVWSALLTCLRAKKTLSFEMLLFIRKTTAVLVAFPVLHFDMTGPAAGSVWRGVFDQSWPAIVLLISTCDHYGLGGHIL